MNKTSKSKWKRDPEDDGNGEGSGNGNSNGNGNNGPPAPAKPNPPSRGPTSVTSQAQQSTTTSVQPSTAPTTSMQTITTTQSVVVSETTQDFSTSSTSSTPSTFTSSSASTSFSSSSLPTSESTSTSSFLTTTISDSTSSTVMSSTPAPPTIAPFLASNGTVQSAGKNHTKTTVAVTVTLVVVVLVALGVVGFIIRRRKLRGRGENADKGVNETGNGGKWLWPIESLEYFSGGGKTGTAKRPESVSEAPMLGAASRLSAVSDASSIFTRNSVIDVDTGLQVQGLGIRPQTKYLEKGEVGVTSSDVTGDSDDDKMQKTNSWWRGSTWQFWGTAVEYPAPVVQRREEEHEEDGIGMGIVGALDDTKAMEPTQPVNVKSAGDDEESVIGTKADADGERVHNREKEAMVVGIENRD